MLEEFCTLVRPYTPTPLASDGQFQSICELARQLPIEGNLGLECRLAPGAHRIDVSQAIPQAEIEWVARRHEARYAGQPPPVWLSVCRDWARMPSASRAAIKHLWFEYDLDRSSQASLDSPSLFIEPACDEKSLDRVSWLDSLAEFIHLVGPPPNIEPSTIARDLAAAWPDDFTLGICGIMRSRQPATLRFLVKAPTVQRAVDFLREQGHPEMSLALSELAATSAGILVPMPILSLDFGTQLVPRLGLEFSVSEASEPWDYAAFLDYLERAGWCCPDKRDALGAFPVSIEPQPDDGEWPEQLLVASLTACEREFSRIAGIVHHFKLLVEPGQPPEAKVYIGFKHLLDAAPGGAAAPLNQSENLR